MISRCKLLFTHHGKTILSSLFSFIIGSTLMLMLVDPDSCDLRRCAQRQVTQSEGDAWLASVTRSKGTGGQAEVVLAILVLSAPDNLEQRSVSRQTWLKHEIEAVRHYFVVGTKQLSSEQNHTLISEQKRFQDLLLLPGVEDSYLSLTGKVLAAFVWLDRNVDFRYVLKCDDDTYVRVLDVVEELEQGNFQDKLYWGFFDGRATVHRTGRWKETDWIMCDRYLPYAKGGGYVLSSDLVHYITVNAPLLKIFRSEDVSVGLWLAPLDLHRVHEVRFDTEYKSRGCNNQYLVTHKQKVQHMKQKYDNLKHLGQLCTTEFQNRNSYQYNWNVPPSQCCIRNDSSLP